jgi:hypothetical protein
MIHESTEAYKKNNRSLVEIHNNLSSTVESLKSISASNMNVNTMCRTELLTIVNRVECLKLEVLRLKDAVILNQAELASHAELISSLSGTLS